MSTDPWVEWFQLVMTGVGAAKDAINSDTMWAWSGAESGADRMRWNNPLNTEYILNGINNPMNPNGVQGYPSPSDGAIATVATLFSGYYPIIISNLVGSVPRAQWGNACGELGVWGTGCGWLNTYYGSPPGIAEENMEQPTVYRNPVDGSEWQLGGDPPYSYKTGVTADRAETLDMIAKLQGFPGLRIIDNANVMLDRLPVGPPVAGTPTPELPEPKTITLSIPSVPGTATGTLT